MGSLRLFHSLLLATVVAKTSLKRAMVVTADTVIDPLVLAIPDGKVVALTTLLAYPLHFPTYRRCRW
jgi:hypothetical protein